MPSHSRKNLWAYRQAYKGNKQIISGENIQQLNGYCQAIIVFENKRL